MNNDNTRYFKRIKLTTGGRPATEPDETERKILALLKCDEIISVRVADPPKQFIVTPNTRWFIG